MANFTRAYLDVVEHLVGVEFHESDVTQWHIHQTEAFMNAERIYRSAHPEVKSLKRDVWDIIEDPGFCAGIPVVKNAREAVGQLCQIADVYVVTSPWETSPTWMHERAAWVREHFGIPKDHVIHASQKHLVHGHVLVDDKPSHVINWAQAWPWGEALCYRMPHNVSEARREGLRLVGWEDVVRIVTHRVGAGMLGRP
jgi:5'(3')-deoxyribonucleotidase